MKKKGIEEQPHFKEKKNTRSHPGRPGFAELLYKPIF